jgi:hypothetical protein
MLLDGECGVGVSDGGVIGIYLDGGGLGVEFDGNGVIGQLGGDAELAEDFGGENPGFKVAVLFA